MKRSEGTLLAWLEAVAHQRTHHGYRAVIEKVKEGTVVTVTLYDHSGNQWVDNRNAGAVFAGNAPRLVAKPANYEYADGGHSGHASYRMSAPSIIYEWASSFDPCSASSQGSYRKVYVCATEEQITNAVSKFLQEQLEEACTADLEPLRKKLEQWFRESGNPLFGNQKGATAILAEIQTVFENGVADSGLLARLGKETGLGIRRLILERNGVCFLQKVRSEIKEKARKNQQSA